MANEDGREDRIFQILDKLNDTVVELKVRIETSLGRIDRIEDRIQRTEQTASEHAKAEHVKTLEERIVKLEGLQEEAKKRLREWVLGGLFGSGIIMYLVEHFIFKTR